MNSGSRVQRFSYLDLGIDGTLLIVKLIIIVGVHLQVVERELLLDSLLECLTFFKGEGIGLGDDGDNVDNVRELLQNDNIDGLEATLKSIGLVRGTWEQIAWKKELTHGQRAG